MIDPKKTYRTRDGREVRIYSIDAGGERPVHGATKDREGWCVKSWRADGTYLTHHESVNLIEVRPRIQREVWVNVYPTCVFACSTRNHADAIATNDRIACVKLAIDVEEGEGL